MSVLQNVHHATPLDNRAARLPVDLRTRVNVNADKNPQNVIVTHPVCQLVRLQTAAARYLHLKCRVIQVLKAVAIALTTNCRLQRISVITRHFALYV